MDEAQPLPSHVPSAASAARKEALRELQARLATQLQAARTQDRGRAWLAVECGETGFLLPLGEAGEIFAFRGSVAVPHTRRWFLGVANLRGQLHGVVDLARFLGLSAASARPVDGWMIAFNPRLESNSALRIDRLAGLRREDQLRLVEPTAIGAGQMLPRPRFAGASFHDETTPARGWQEISLAGLAEDAHFLSIAVPP